MKIGFSFALALISLGFTNCGQPNSSAIVAESANPDAIRAEKSCAAMRRAQLEELCDSQIRHIPICDKVCVEFVSVRGAPVKYECAANSPVISRGICNFRNTWNPGLFN